MKKRTLLLTITALLIIAACFTGCGQSANQTQEAAEATTEAKEPEYIGAAYGYTGDDPVVLAVYKYMVEEVGKSYDKSDVSIPTVAIVYTDSSDENDIKVYGDFWIENYKINDKILECESGGNYPGVMHVKKDGDNYTVTKFDIAEDGENFDASARELFGDHLEDFMKVFSDDKAKDELRKETIRNYVKMNKLPITAYQDYGWDPVQLDN